MEGSSPRTYNIMVYGIEKIGLTAPGQDIVTRNYRLNFQPFHTEQRFNDFDGVILFQGIFESFETVRHHAYTPTSLIHKFDRDELDKRKKELSLLFDKGGFACFLLIEQFSDSNRGEHILATDLTKFNLLYPDFYRENFDSRRVRLAIKRDEFKRFLEIYGAAWSYFQNLNTRIDLKVIAQAAGYITGMILGGQKFFVPSLEPDEDKLTEYFSFLADALIATINKLIYEVPSWVNVFKFDEETKLSQQRDALAKQMSDTESRISTLQTSNGFLFAMVINSCKLRRTFSGEALIFDSTIVMNSKRT